MKQVIRKGLKDIIVDEVPDPALLPNHVLVRPVYSLISSGTETASIHADSLVKEVAENPSQLRKVWDVMKLSGPIPTIREVMAKFSDYAVLGYSGAGVVAVCHPGVTDLQAGDRVAYGGEGTGHGETIQTGRNLVARMPDDVAFEDAAFSTLGAIALNAVRISQVGVGDRVAVIGLGLVGQLATQLASIQGASVVAVDLRPERIELARQLGADHGFPGGDSLREAVMALTNGIGVDCVIVAAAAKSAGPCQQALQICRDRGRIVVVGAVEMEFPWLEAYLKEIQILMSRAYGPGSYDPLYEKKGIDYPLPYVRWTENRNMEEILRLISRGGLKVAPLVTDRFELQQAPDAYQKIMAPGSASLAVLLRYPAADAPEKAAAAFVPTRRVDLAGPPAPSGGIRVALAGGANIARWWHLPALKKISGTSLRAVYSTQGPRGKSYANRFKAQYCCSDYQQILDDKDVDAVLIVSRNQEHAAQALQALNAGKHVFVEKPMALTEQECHDLMAAVERTGKVLSVGFNRRFSPYYLEQKKVFSKRPGPSIVSCRMNSPGISGNFWMADPAIGGAILGEACHFIDLMYWLLESEPVSVSAYSLPTGKKDPIGENNIVASFQFADGSIGNLTYTTVGSKTSGGERVEVYASGIGCVTEDFKRISIRGRMEQKRSKWIADKGYDPQMADFIDAIRQNRRPKVDVRDGARSTIGCLRMMEAAKLGVAQSISLEPAHQPAPVYV